MNNLHDEHRLLLPGCRIALRRPSRIARHTTRKTIEEASMRISNTFGPAGMLLLVLFIEWSAVKAADFHVAKGDVYGSKGLVAAIMMANRDVEPDNIILETGEYVLTKPDNNTDGPNGLPD